MQKQSYTVFSAESRSPTDEFVPFQRQKSMKNKQTKKIRFFKRTYFPVARKRYVAKQKEIAHKLCPRRIALVKISHFA